jgi:hypothetical protein
MSIELIYNILSNDPGVTALVGSRITPFVRTQNLTLPAVTMQRITMQPTNALSGDANMDHTRMQVNSFAETYDQTTQVANACRRAIQAAGYLLSLEIDNFDDQAELAGVPQISQEYEIWAPFT